MTRGYRAARATAVVLAALALAGAVAPLLVWGQGGSTIGGAYLLAFHACDSGAGLAVCNDPRNHRVYLAQSNVQPALRRSPR